MAAIRAYTTIEQSRKLAEILPIESADMWYQYTGISIKDGSKKPIYFPMVIRDCESDEDIPCWSLAALLGLIPCSYRVYRHPYDDGLSLSLEISNCIEVTADNEMDACYKMILKLHDLNLL